MAESIVWNVSADDIQKSKIVDKPCWLPVEVYSFAIEDAKDKSSKNLHIKIRVFGNAEYNGMENEFIYFNEKKPEMAIPFLKAIGFTQNPDGSFSQKLSEENIKGKRCKAHWIRGEYKNKPQNEIDDWAKLED